MRSYLGRINKSRVVLPYLAELQALRPKTKRSFAIEDSESQIPIRMHVAVKISPDGEEEEGEERNGAS